MYSYIKGELVEMTEDSIVVETYGIGYNIRIPQSILDSFTGIGQKVKIYTYTYVREDAIHLYGFLSRDDLMVFQLLLGVSGIGPKGALAILSVMTPDDLRFAVLGEDDKTIAKAPGIGKKSAQRLIIELKDKLKLEDAAVIKSSSEPSDHSEGAGIHGIKKEAVMALTALGYSSGEAMKVVSQVEIKEDSSVEEVLKASLKQMAWI